MPEEYRKVEKCGMAQFVIVLDHCDYLHHIDKSILYSLLNLPVYLSSPTSSSSSASSSGMYLYSIYVLSIFYLFFPILSEVYI